MRASAGNTTNFGEQELPRYCVIFSAIILYSSIVCYLEFVGKFFPGPNGMLGQDYEYFLPLVLVGKYILFTNGFLTAPIFSPSFCGGLPFLSNPQSVYYSIPQVLSEFLDPVFSFYITAISSATTGAICTYFLLRRRFHLSCEAAAIGGVLFLFNGFILHRMLIGHVTYHSVGLTPLCCFLLLTQRSRSSIDDRYLSLGNLARSLGIAVILAYFVYSGALNMVVPLVLAVLLVWLVHAIVGVPSYPSLWVGALGILFGGMLSAAKLAPAFVYVQAFPRPGQLRLFDTPFDLLTHLAAGLFFPFLLRDKGYFMRHEGEFGVGIIPPFVIILALISTIHRKKLKVFARRILEKWPYWLGLLVNCLVPIIVNYGGQGFDVVLKRIPYINNNTMLIRWFWIYIPMLCMMVGILFDYVVRTAFMRVLGLVISALVTVIIATETDHNYYFHQQTYNPSSMIMANAALENGKPPPQIVSIGLGESEFPNDGFVHGISQYPCYEPLFGYDLETFPPGLKTGHISGRGLPSLRNPACYIYGAANGCSPGEVFAPIDADQATMFAQYRNFRYIMPAWQKIADCLSVLTLLVVLVFPVYAIVCLTRRRITRKHPAEATD